jgi:immunity protein 7 of polymorphic toxin system
MYEFHGWFGLAESAEESDTGTLAQGVADLTERVNQIRWATAAATVRMFNGEHFLNVDGLVNRRRDEAEELDALLEYVGQRFPGSYGLLYERAADMPEPPGQGAFRVRVMTRGRLAYRGDPFLSPIHPVIED